MIEIQKPNTHIIPEQRVQRSQIPCCPSDEPARQRINEPQVIKRIEGSPVFLCYHRYRCSKPKYTLLTKQRTHNTESIRHLLKFLVSDLRGNETGRVRASGPSVLFRDARLSHLDIERQKGSLVKGCPQGVLSGCQDS